MICQDLAHCVLTDAAKHGVVSRMGGTHQPEAQRSLVHQRVVVEMPDNTIEAASDTQGTEYQLTHDGTTLVTVTTRWTPGGGSCTADIAGEDQVLMLAVVVAIETIHHQEENQ